MTYILNILLLVFVWFLIGYSYNFLIKIINTDFIKYLKETKKSGLFHLQLFSYFFVVYFLYKDHLVNIDNFFSINEKVILFINLNIVNKIVYTTILIFVCRTIIFLLNSFNDFQKTTFLKPNTLINNYTKVLNFMVIVGGVIVSCSIWFEVHVITLVAGLSTASAVFALIFRDFILGVITSITSANSNIVRIGDFINLEKHNIKGVVIDINITTVKIQAVDEGIISFPSYWLINDVMKNSWKANELKIKQIELEFYVKISFLSKINLYDIEEIIMKNFCFYNQKNIIISYINDKYNLGILKCSFFVELKDIKELEECKINLYSNISSYLEKNQLLIEYNNLINN